MAHEELTNEDHIRIGKQFAQRAEEFDEAIKDTGLPHNGLPTKLDYKRMYDAGVLRLDQLEHGKYYLGVCRNARVAMWDGEKQKFIYMRQKFNYYFPEDIEHPANDNGYDLFVPIKEVEPTEDERIPTCAPSQEQKSSST